MRSSVGVHWSSNVLSCTAMLIVSLLLFLEFVPAQKLEEEPRVLPTSPLPTSIDDIQIAPSENRSTSMVFAKELEKEYSDLHDEPQKISDQNHDGDDLERTNQDSKVLTALPLTEQPDKIESSDDPKLSKQRLENDISNAASPLGTATNAGMKVGESYALSPAELSRRAPDVPSELRGGEVDDEFDSEPVMQLYGEPMINEVADATEPDISKVTSPQPPNKEQFEEPVVDACAIVNANNHVATDAKRKSEEDKSLVEEPAYIIDNEKKIEHGNLKETPQSPNKEQHNEPVVDVSFKTNRATDEAERAIEMSPVEEPDVTNLIMTETADRKAIPQSPSYQHVEEPVVDAAIIAVNVVTEATDEQLPVDEPASRTTNNGQTTAPEPPTRLQLNEYMGGSTAHIVHAKGATQAEQESVIAQREVPTAKPPKKGSLAEFFQNANKMETGIRKQRSDASKMQRNFKRTAGDRDPSKTAQEGTIEREQIFLKRHKGETAMGIPDGQIAKAHCGMWGDYNFGRRRPANLSILHQLFQDVIVDGKNDATHVENPPLGIPNDVVQEWYVKGNVEEGPQAAKAKPPGETAATDAKAKLKSANNEFFAGLDDIDKLFEGIYPPDELDVGADGTSIQEVLMGSATRVLIKRISVGAGVVKNKILNAKDSSVGIFRKTVEKYRPLQKFYKEKVVFAPFRRLRDDDGKFSPFRKFQDELGKLTLPSKDQLIRATHWVWETSVKFYHRTERFLDKLFEGGEVDETVFNIARDSRSEDNENASAERENFLQPQEVRQPEALAR